MSDDRKSDRIDGRANLIVDMVMEMGIGLSDDWPDALTAHIMSESLIVLSSAMLKIVENNSDPALVLNRLVSFFNERIKDFEGKSRVH